MPKISSVESSSFGFQRPGWLGWNWNEEIVNIQLNSNLIVESKAFVNSFLAIQTEQRCHLPKT